MSRRPPKRPPECRHRRYSVLDFDRKIDRVRMQWNVRKRLKAGTLDRMAEEVGVLTPAEKDILVEEGVEAWDAYWTKHKEARGVGKDGKIDPEVNPEGAKRQEKATERRVLSIIERKERLLRDLRPQYERYRDQIKDHPDFENKDTAARRWLSYIEHQAMTATEVAKGLEKLDNIFGHDAKNVKIEHTHRIQEEELDALLLEGSERLRLEPESLKDAEAVVLEAVTSEEGSSESSSG